MAVCPGLKMGVFSRIIRMLSRFVIVTVGIACLAVLWSCSRFLFRRPICPSYGGFTHPDFEDVKQAYVQNILSGLDKGSSFAVYRNGEPLVDLWGGCADEHEARAWTKDTISQVWSVTKGITSILLATLIDKGRLDIHQKVAHYWPEFAQNGKENITVGTLFSHQAGLTELERIISLQEYRDSWTTVEALLAKQTPVWKPGTKYHYHALTWGMYADALVRKADGNHRTVSQYFREEIADKIEGLDLYIGLPDDQRYRSTRGSYTPMWVINLEIIFQPHFWHLLPNLIKYKEILLNSQHVFHFTKNLWTMDAYENRSVGLPSANGFGNARSVAKLFDFAANNGTVRGKRLLNSETVATMSASVTKDAQALFVPNGPVSPLGFMLDPVRTDCVGHRGYGGQIGYADRKQGIAVGYVTNYKETSGLTEDPRIVNVIDIFYRCLHEKFNKP